jgi:hypothetical protein
MVSKLLILTHSRSKPKRRLFIYSFEVFYAYTDSRRIRGHLREREREKERRASEERE